MVDKFYMFGVEPSAGWILMFQVWNLKFVFWVFESHSDDI